MSWSISSIGKPAAVAKEVARRAASVRCAEPEESVKNTVAEIVAKLAATMPIASVVKVEASGSQAKSYDQADALTHSLSVKIETVYGFVE